MSNSKKPSRKKRAIKWQGICPLCLNAKTLNSSLCKDCKPKDSKKIGRPSGYSKELASQICERLACGESLRQILLLEGMPTQSMVFRWLADNEDFREQYRVAREMQMESHLEQIQEIAHDGRNDWEIIESERTGQERIVLNSEAVQRSRLRVDTLKWVMSKLAPKKYGEKIEAAVTHGVSDPLAQLIRDIRAKREVSQ